MSGRIPRAGAPVAGAGGLVPGAGEALQAEGSALADRGLPLLERVRGAARPGEIATGWLRAERSDFVRFNRGRIRQAGTVEKASIELRLLREGRQAGATLTLSGDPAADASRLDAAFAMLRDDLASCDPDPWLVVSESPTQSRTVLAGDLPEADALCDAVLAAAGPSDLVGFYAGGPLACGYASSLGHLHWHETRPWFLDFSIQTGGDKAVKRVYAPPVWDPGDLTAAIARARREAQVLLRPPRVLSPGEYRAWLAPAALADLVGMLNWGGFSASALRSGHSPLARLAAGQVALNPAVTLVDDIASAGLPSFQSDGFLRPDRLALVEAGRHAGSLVSPRTGREFGLADTGADPSETAQALAMAAGALPEDEALTQLRTGVAVSDLWYLNWSDRAAARLTGMTRFATMWVEDGEPVAPLAVMRFDDTLFRLLGPGLQALSRERHRIPDTQTYEARAFGQAMVPGALVEGLRFTL
jgi:predicted Zn-dependent protease